MKKIILFALLALSPSSLLLGMNCPCCKETYALVDQKTNEDADKNSEHVQADFSTDQQSAKQDAEFISFEEYMDSARDNRKKPEKHRYYKFKLDQGRRAADLELLRQEHYPNMSPENFDALAKILLLKKMQGE